jgi:hypothetical protein
MSKTFMQVGAAPADLAPLSSRAPAAPKEALR